MSEETTASAEGTTLVTEATTPDAETLAPDAEISEEAQEAEATPETEPDEATEPSEETEDTKAEGPPEKYEFEFGENTQIDTEHLAELEQVSRDLNLSQADAQKFASIAERMSQKWAQDLTDMMTTTRAGWRKAAETDAEIGGDAMPQNLAVAKQSLKDFGDAELMKVLDDTGLGDNPAFIRYAYRVGKANSEHAFVKSGRVAAEVSFYDHPTSKPKG